MQGGAFSQGTAEVADLFLQGLLDRVIVLELNLSLGRHWAEALAVSAANQNAIQIIETRNMLAGAFIREDCTSAFGRQPSYVARTQVEGKGVLVVGTGRALRQRP